MGCSASVSPSTTIQSIKKIDAETNTMPDEFLSSPTPIIEPIKQLVEISTQTDNVEIDVKMGQTAVVSRNSDSNLNSKDDNPSRTSDNEEKPNGSIDDYINPRFNQGFDGMEELEWVLHGLDANQFCISNQNLLISTAQVTPTIVVNAIEKTSDLDTVSKTVWKLLYQARETDDATYLIPAYITESNFYRILNRKLAQQTLDNPDNLTLNGQLQSMMSNAFATNLIKLYSIDPGISSGTINAIYI